MGRRKIEIKPIRDDRNRSVTFLKRKGGLFKKAHELSVLCSVDVAVIIFGHNKKLYEYSSGDINDIIGRFNYYGGAHEHKGPQDFADKAGGDDDDDEDGGDHEMGAEERGTPAPEHTMMHPQMAHHPGFQHVRHGTPQQSPPMHNGAMPQFQRGASPLPPGMSRPSSRNDQHPHQQHIRRTSSNLVPQAYQQGQPQPSYAYTPNPPFYNPQTAAQNQMQRPPPGPPISQGATFPPPYPPQHAVAQSQMQQAQMQGRRSPLPPAYPNQPPPQPNMQRHSSQEHLQPPQPHPHSSPRPVQQGPTPSPQPPQHQFQSPPIPQPKPLPAHAKNHSIFTPIDDSRSLLAQHWGATSSADGPKAETEVKVEGGGPRSASIDVAQMQREAGRANGISPRPSAMPPPNKSPQPPQRTASTPNIGGPTRSNTQSSSDAKRPRLKVQIPSEHSGDEAATAESGQDDTSTSQPPNTSGIPVQPAPSHGVVLPPPSPSAGALLSAGAQGPPNPFARPAPPMSTNPHAANRDAANHIETPISALPSRFMTNDLLPSPSSFFSEWNLRSGDNNMLPSPLNFQTPVMPNGASWRDEDRKRANDDSEAGDPKRTKT